MREAAQVVAYEIPLGLSLLVPLMVLGTFNLVEASAAQQGWFGMQWAVFQNPFVLPALLLFFTAALAETKRAPFDLPEAESELVAGFMTEYSGIRWSFFFMEEYAAMFLMSGVTAIFFLGGFESPLTAFARAQWGQSAILTQLVCAGTLIVKAFTGVFVMMWVRWTLPRIRIDQVMTMGYKYLTPLALVCVMFAGLFEAIKPRFLEPLPVRIAGAASVVPGSRPLPLPSVSSVVDPSFPEEDRRQELTTEDTEDTEPEEGKEDRNEKRGEKTR
jgi:NADH-quinone oxidoreductase subunit H